MIVYIDSFIAGGLMELAVVVVKRFRTGISMAYGDRKWALRRGAFHQFQIHR